MDHVGLFNHGDWGAAISALRGRDVRVRDGLSAVELDAAEARYGFQFPPDLRSFLSVALPSGDRFPDWRDLRSTALADQMVWPVEGIEFDIEHSGFWWPQWGPRPAELSAALRRARECLATVPKLIPLRGHRYLPAEPCLSGNPVLSVHQTDVIYYGRDLETWILHEFGGGVSYEQAIDGSMTAIPFWSALIEAMDREYADGQQGEV
jgi:hypothetical protein